VWAEVVEVRVAAAAVVEHLDGLALVGQACRSRSSVCRVAKKLSATALSAGVPLLPMLGTMPLASRCLPKRRLP